MTFEKACGVAFNERTGTTAYQNGSGSAECMSASLDLTDCFELSARHLPRTKQLWTDQFGFYEGIFVCADRQDPNPNCHFRNLRDTSYQRKLNAYLIKCACNKYLFIVVTSRWQGAPTENSWHKTCFV